MYKGKEQTKGKGEFMIVGSLEEITNLAFSQKRYVGKKYDINGAIASVCLEDFAKFNHRYVHFITGTNHNGEKEKYKCGSQCKWLWTGSNYRRESWINTICRIYKTNKLTKLYVLSVFFKNKTSVSDGNPFIGGTYDKDKDNTLLDTAHRELNEEVGLNVKENCKLYTIPTVSKDRAIWLVNACDVYDSKGQPVEIK